MKFPRPSGRNVSGFTLIEVMITVAIIAILAAIAVPSYVEHVRRARRMAAVSSLQEIVHLMERNRTTSNCYNYSSAPECAAQSGTAFALPTAMSVSPTEGAAYYDITISALSANAYTLAATPRTSMGSDGCGKLTITHTGVRSSEYAGSNCWGD